MAKAKSNFLKESLLDYDSLANSLKESTQSAVRDLLNEAVRDTYGKILSESEEDDDKDENDYTVEEVDDTTSEDEPKETESPISGETEEPEGEAEGGKEDEAEGGEDLEPSGDSFDGESAESDVPSEEGEDEWSSFDDYKKSDDEYDFSQADDSDIIKVYKLLKDTDQVMVKVNDDKVELKDNTTDTEYLIDVSGIKDGGEQEPTDVVDGGASNELEIDDTESINDEDNMNESKIVFEVALNEYDSHVGYTDNYQKKDVMTTDGMSEPGKNVNDWDAGVPKGTKKPWAKDGDTTPFTEEEEVAEEPMEEATNVGGFVQQNSTSKSHVPNSNGRKARNSSVAGVKTKGTPNPRYSEATNESKKMFKKVDAILKENNNLKNTLLKFKKTLEEAAVTNVNLGHIIKIITENSTTKKEKQDIIARFGKDANTVQESKNVYESIVRELQNAPKTNVNEEKQFTANSSKSINETQIYTSKDLMESLDLMHRLCK